MVTGYVRNSAGRPVTGTDVHLLAPAHDSNGGRTLTAAGAGRTNDRGEYRIYWVTPGRYYLATGPSRIGPAALGGSPNEPRQGALPSFLVCGMWNAPRWSRFGPEAS